MKEIEKNRIHEITENHTWIIGHTREGIQRAMRIGELLIQQKNELDHGHFTPWIESSLPFNIRTAQRYMKVYENREKIKNDSVSLLTEAYRQLESPEEKTIFEMSVDELCKYLEDILGELHLRGKAISKGLVEDWEPAIEKDVWKRLESEVKTAKGIQGLKDLSKLSNAVLKIQNALAVNLMRIEQMIGGIIIDIEKFLGIKIESLSSQEIERIQMLLYKRIGELKS